MADRFWCGVYGCWFYAAAGSRFCVAHRFAAGEIAAAVPAGEVAALPRQVGHVGRTACPWTIETAVAAVCEVSRCVSDGDRPPTKNEMVKYGFGGLIGTLTLRRMGISWRDLVACAGFTPLQPGERPCREAA